MPHSLTTPPTTDPTPILRYRDGLYGVDLLAAAISHLDFFTWLEAHPGSGTAAVRAHFDFAERPADVFLTLCRANGFITTDPASGTHTLTDLAREHLVRTSPFFLGPYYDSLKDRPVALDYLKVLRTGRTATWGSLEDESDDWHAAMLTDDFARDFTAAMNCRGLALGQALARGLTADLAGRRHVLDIGAGSGIYAATLVTAHPHLMATVLEQAPVDAIARRAIGEHGLTENIDVVTGDMFSDPWPEAPDVHLFSNVLHDWDFPEIRALLEKSASTLPAGGLVVIHEAFINEDKTGPLPVAEYSALLMHATQGKCYAPSEYGPILEELGLTPGPYHDTLADRGYMTAVKR